MIGTHTVQLIPDPNVPVWSAPLASNPLMTSDIQGWKGAPFVNPWTWSGGQAIPPAVINGSAGLFRDPAFSVARGTHTQYRVRAVVTTTGAGWIIPGLYFGLTAQDAYQGPFWSGNACINRSQWFWAGTAGTYTVETIIDPTDIGSSYAFLGPYVDYLWDQNAAQPGRPVSVDSIELVGLTYASIVDLSCLVDQVTIRHGREETTGQPEASTATLDLSLDSETDRLPDGIDMGSIIRVYTEIPDLTSARFVGRVSDFSVGWDSAGEDTPFRLVAQIVATGDLGDLGRRVVGDVADYPEELDGARVARILTEAGVTVDAAYNDPGVATILGRFADEPASALELAHAAANSASGILWQARTGAIRYADAEHRRAATAGLRLDACDLLVTPSWLRNIDGLANDVTVSWGYPEDNEDDVILTNPTSQTRYGRYEYNATVDLVNEADALALARLVITRNAFPVWTMQQLPVDVAGLDEARTSALLSMDVHDLLELTGLPYAGDAPTSTAMWVEGWTETLTFGGHDLLLNVSGYCRTSPPPRWDDMSPARTWDSMGSVTWDDAACLGPQQNTGRWVNVAATTRWDQLTPGQTWDTFTGDVIPPPVTTIRELVATGD